MRFFAFAIGAALANTPAPVDTPTPDVSLQQERPATSDSTATPAKKPTKPGPEVMKPLPAKPDLCLTARCATV